MYFITIKYMFYSSRFSKWNKKNINKIFMYTYSIKLVYWQLLLYGVHVGHSFTNSIIFSAWLVYTYRQNILIINLFKTVLMFKNGYVGLSGACTFGGPIWFINLHRSVELFVNYSAKQCGEFCYTTYWIHGLISNWLTLANTFRKLNRMVLTSNKGQFAKLELDSSPLIMGRFSWPRATFISSVSTSPYPTKESLYLGIPCLGIVDTDVSGHIANIAIPGNDDSLDCIVFYNTHISQYILEKKYGNVSGWFYHIRKNKRAILFLDWIFNFYISKDGNIDKAQILYEQAKKNNSVSKLKSDLVFKVPYSTIWTYGLDFFFSKNYGLNSFKEQVDLYEPDEQLIDFDLDYYFSKHRKDSVYITKIINYYIIKSSWRFNRFIKRKTFKNKLFRRRFLIGVYEGTCHWDITNSKNYMKSRFFVNRFYKTHLRRNILRFNKFILKFVKFFFVSKFMNCRAFMGTYNSNLMIVSNLAFAAMSFGSRIFIKNLFSPILKYSNQFVNNIKLTKKNVLYKWYFLRKNINKQLVGFSNKNKINKYMKLSLKLETTKYLTFFLQKKLQSFYMYYTSFFNFFLWNRAVFFQNKIEYNRYCLKRWKVLKSIQRNYLYIEFLNKAIKSYNFFKQIFGKKENNIFRNNFNKVIYFFNILTIEYKKTFFLDIKSFKYNRLLILPKYFAKILKKNKKKRDWILKKISKKVKVFLFIKNKKNYKGRKKYRKIITYKRTILKPYSEVRYFGNKYKLSYKKNKYLKILNRQKGTYSPHRLLTLNNYLTNLSKLNKKINKVSYLFKNVINFSDLKFIHTPLTKFNENFASSKLSSIEHNYLNNHDLMLFFSKYTYSVYRLNLLINRYYYPYFFRWNLFNNLDNNNLSKLLKETRKIIQLEANLQYNNNLSRKIKVNSNYIFLRKRSHRIYKKQVISDKGISNYFLVGNYNYKTIFIDRFWIYSKSNFLYPSFFYLNKSLNKNLSLVKKTKTENKKYSYFLFSVRFFSLYHKFFYSFYLDSLPWSSFLFIKYDTTQKRIFWN